MPLGSLHQADHSIQKGFSGIRSNSDFDDVGEHARATGDCAAVASGLAHDRSRLAGNGGFVHRRSAFDDLPVTRDQLPSLDNNEISLAQLLGR